MVLCSHKYIDDGLLVLKKNKMLVRFLFLLQLRLYADMMLSYNFGMCDILDQGFCARLYVHGRHIACRLLQSPVALSALTSCTH